jgi:hypothetical protein
MWTYAYKHGDRPLEGYTIERAAGRGGFGEVYYAISDSGREVALKSITGFEQIELRGISQCMNLKSPHLVSIFDIRQTAEGRWFVIMEFVNGPNLRELLDAAPAGLGPQKAAFFLREIAKGLSYLHDCGIVHRDLKPANIFFENGYAKIGDYGLSKAIAPTHHSGQTVTVGTVHYMAPEVGMGKYDRSIDIYALGALLYEMMTGIVPFVGASAGEILIKHLSHDADCSGIPEPFCSAIKRAMAKDPAERFQTVQEMVEAVFGAEHVRNSVSQFSPTDLSMVAGRIAERIAMPAVAGAAAAAAGIPSDAPLKGGPIGGGSSVTNPNGLGSPRHGETMFASPFRQAFGQRWGATGSHAEPATAVPPPPPPPLESIVAQADPVNLPQRIALAVVAALVVATACVAFDQPGHESDIWLYVVLSVLGGAVGVLFAARRWLPAPTEGSVGWGNWGDRLALGAVAAATSLATAAPVWMNSWDARQGIGMHVVIAVVALAIANPRRLAEASRARRISFRQVAIAAVIAFIGAGIAAAGESSYVSPDDRVHQPGEMVIITIAVIGGIALVMQVLASWDERRAWARSSGAAGHASGSPAGQRATPVTPAAHIATPVAGAAAGGGVAAAATAAAAAAAAAARTATGRAKPPPLPTALSSSPPSARTATTTFGVFPPQTAGRPVPRWLAIVWFCSTAVSFAIAVALHVFTGSTRFSHRDEEATFIALTLVAYVLTTFFFARMWKRVIRSWVSYLVVPVFRLVCAVIALGSWAFVANARLPNEAQAVFAVAIAVFGVCWIVTWVLPWLWRAAVPPAEGEAAVVAGSWPTASTGLSSMFAGARVGSARVVPAEPSTAYALGAAVGEMRSAIKMPVFGEDSPNSRAEKYRRKARLRRVRWAGRDRDVDHALRVAARFDRKKRWREGRASLMRPLGGVGLVIGFVAALAAAVDAPAMVAAGFPDAGLAPAIARDVFGGKVADWPRLASPLLVVAASVVMLLGLIGVMLGRRHDGASHMLRAIVGVGFLVLALLPVAAVFHSVKPWHEVAMLPMPQRSVWLVVRTVFEQANVKVIIVPLLTAAFGSFLLALPPRRLSAAAQSAAAAAAAPYGGKASDASSATAVAPPAQAAPAAATAQARSEGAAQ